MTAIKSQRLLYGGGTLHCLSYLLQWSNRINTIIRTAVRFIYFLAIKSIVWMQPLKSVIKYDCDWKKKRKKNTQFSLTWQILNAPIWAATPSFVTSCPISFVHCCCHVLFVSVLPLGHMGHSRWGRVVRMLHQRLNISIKVGLFHGKKIIKPRMARRSHNTFT